MKRLCSEKEREILTYGHRTSTAGEILSQKRNFIAPVAYKHRRRILSFIARIVRSCRELNFIAAPIAICAASWNLRLPLAIKFTQHEQAALECGGNSNSAANEI